jgi:TRAP-type C4-dicarboxylate transport system permease small subunit
MSESLQPDPPTLSVRLEQAVATLALALLLLLTLANVLTRYFTDQSFAWTEEISVFLMVLMAFAGASAATARDQHIRIEFFYDSGSPERRRALRIFAALITTAFFVLLAVLFGRIVADEIKYAETTTGLGIPRWWFTAVLPVLCITIALRAAGLTMRAVRRRSQERIS